eukprot:g68090.t1
MLLQQWRARSQQGLCSKRRPWIVTTYNPPNAPTQVCLRRSIWRDQGIHRHLATPLDMLHTAVIRSLPGSTLSWKDSFQFRYLIAQEAQELGVARTARKYSVSYGKARYWADKLHGSNPGVHGGHRYQTLTQEAQLALEWTIFLIWEADPNLRDYQVVQILRDELGWSWLGDQQTNAAIKRIQRIRKNYDLYRRRNCRSSRGRRVVLGRDMSEHVDVTSNQTASPRSSARVRHNYGDRELFWLKFTVLLQTQPVCNQSLRSTDIVFHNFRSY